MNAERNAPRPPPRRKRLFLRSASVDVLVKSYDDNNNRDNFILCPDTNSRGPSQDQIGLKHYEQDMTSLKGRAPAPTGDSVSGRSHEAETSSLVEMSASDHQGWLVDQLRGKKVWGAISQGALNIFETETTSLPRRTIALQECRVRRLEFTLKTDQASVNGVVVRHFSTKSTGSDKHQFVIENTHSKLNFAFGVSSRQELDRWIAALRCASYADIDSKSSEDTGISLDSSIASVESDFAKLRVSPDLSGIPKTPSPRLRTHRSSLSFTQPQDVKRNSVVEILKKHRKEGNDHDLKNQPMRATHDADEPETEPSESRRKSRSFLKNPFDNLFRRKKRSSSADDARGRRKSSSSEKSKNDSRLSDSFESSSSKARDRQNSQGSTSSYSPEVTPRYTERSSSRSVSLSLRRTASDLKSKLFGDYTDEDYVGISLSQLRDVKVSGFLQYRHDYKYVKVFCTLSRGWLYLFKTDKQEELALLSIRLSQCSVQYVADLEKRKKSLFAFKVSQPECPSVYLVSDDHQSLIKWIMAVQAEASSIQAEKGLAVEIREKKSVQKARVAQELGLSPSDKNLSKQAELRLKRNSCPTFSQEELSLIQEPQLLTTPRVPRMTIPSTPEDDCASKDETDMGNNSVLTYNVKKMNRLSLHIPDEKVISSSFSPLRIIPREDKNGSFGKEPASGSPNVEFHLPGAITKSIEMNCTADDRIDAVTSPAVLPHSAVPTHTAVPPHLSVTNARRTRGTYSQEVKHESERLLQKASATVRRATSLYIPSNNGSIFCSGSSPSAAPSIVFKQRVTSLLPPAQGRPSGRLSPERTSSLMLSSDNKNTSTLAQTSTEPSKLSSTAYHDSSELKHQYYSSSSKLETVDKDIQLNGSSEECTIPYYSTILAKDTKCENSLQSESDDNRASSSPSLANNRYSFESNVHDSALKDSWSTDESFLLAILSDQLRQRRQRGSHDAVSSSSDDTVLVFNDDASTARDLIRKVSSRIVIVIRCY
ncbi:hypothetical protein Btru_030364 [Bulinus truncatus]|nr:hypothetical protein Btru_030364 [Bulinus truncatus]